MLSATTVAAGSSAGSSEARVQRARLGACARLELTQRVAESCALDVNLEAIRQARHAGLGT